ncbi:hypothetical protein C8J57DRAFT_1167086 [Mycena rebaudengoi]|nr:hypothetical protein C8J57DRAFT_1167086 [Mycena rebaudengoi]
MESGTQEARELEATRMRWAKFFECADRGASNRVLRGPAPRETIQEEPVVTNYPDHGPTGQCILHRREENHVESTSNAEGELFGENAPVAEGTTSTSSPAAESDSTRDPSSATSSNGPLVLEESKENPASSESDATNGAVPKTCPTLPLDASPAPSSQPDVPGEGEFGYPTLCTTLPPNAGPDEPVTECFLLAETKEYFINLPGFPKPPTNPATATYRVGLSPGKGLGLFSTRKLKMGQIVLSERPLLIAMRAMRDGRLHPDMDSELLFRFCEHLERNLEICVARMAPAAREAWYALENSYTEEQLGPNVGRMQTNGIDVPGLKETTGTGGSIYAAVFKDISRLNHSCSPNVRPYFNAESLSYQILALRDIAKGEELTFMYLDIRPLAKERRQKLQDYFLFNCTCTACCDAQVSDARRSNAQKCPSVRIWLLRRNLPDDWLINRCRAQITLLEEEGLQTLREYWDNHLTIMEAYICLGDAANASVYAKKLRKFTWEGRGDHFGVARLVDPASKTYKMHWLWRVRVDSLLTQEVLEAVDILRSQSHARAV